MSQQYVRHEVPLSGVTTRIIAAAKEVHSTLGPGFREWFCQRALDLDCRRTTSTSAARCG